VARDFLNNTSEFKTIEACNKNLLKENKLNYQKYAKKDTPILRLFKTDIKNMRPFKKKITIEKYAKRRVNKFARSPTPLSALDSCRERNPPTGSPEC
jgi:hypothetical protein